MRPFLLRKLFFLVTVLVEIGLIACSAGNVFTFNGSGSTLRNVIWVQVRGKTAATGATTTNTLVNIGDFFLQQIEPELRSPNVDESPILKADALKFLTTFRSQIPKAKILELFPALILLLGAEANVVHSYAAMCLERILGMKVRSCWGLGVGLFGD